MYDKEKINELTELYLRSGRRKVRDNLLEALLPMVRAVLGMNYNSFSLQVQEDCANDAMMYLMKTLKDREKLQGKKFRVASAYFYQVIRGFLNYEFVYKKKKKEAGFRVLNFGDLGHQDRQMLGLPDGELIESQNQKY